MEYKQHSTTSRYVALVAVLTAIYTAYGYVSGIALQPLTQSLDLFFLLPVFFAILVSLTGKRWSSTLLGTIIGLLFLYPTAGVPLSPHITISLIINGFVFDLYLRESKTSLYDLSRRQLITASALGNLGMAIGGLLVFQLFSQTQSAYLWAFALISDTLVGAAGGFFGSVIIDRVRGAQTRKALEARASMRVRAQALIGRSSLRSETRESRV
jgi:hypothetical protein